MSYNMKMENILDLQTVSNKTKLANEIKARREQHYIVLSRVLSYRLRLEI